MFMVADDTMLDFGFTSLQSEAVTRMSPKKTVTLYAAGEVQMKKLRTVADAMAAYSETDVEIVAVSDLGEMARAGVSHLPAVAVDGRVVFSGQTPTADELRHKVNEAAPAA